MTDAFINGRYRIRTQRQRDGCALYYAAVDAHRAQEVALLKTGMAPDEAMERCRALHSLANYAHTDTVIDAFVADNTAWAVLSPREEVSLQAFTKRRRLSAGELRSVAASAANALLVVHSLGMVHGCLTGSRILLNADGSVRLTGFFSRRSCCQSTIADDLAALGQILCACCCLQKMPAEIQVLLHRLSTAEQREGMDTVFDLLHALDALETPVKTLKMRSRAASLCKAFDANRTTALWIFGAAAAAAVAWIVVVLTV